MSTPEIEQITRQMRLSKQFMCQLGCFQSNSVETKLTRYTELVLFLAPDKVGLFRICLFIYNGTANYAENQTQHYSRSGLIFENIWIMFSVKKREHCPGSLD